MERIIITEVDNTSNVEALSSYDVVYVPGFSNNHTTPEFVDGQQTLFRTPTLVTSKYEFTKLFGSECPTFPKDQPYPVATATKYGFPSYAIPGYVPPTDPIPVANVREIEIEIPEDTQPGDSDRQAAIIEAIEEQGNYFDGFYADEDWTPTESETYYWMEQGADDLHYTVKSLDMLDPELYKGELIFENSVVPVEMGWKIMVNGSAIYTDDANIEFDLDGATRTTVRNYLADETVPAMMFYGPSEDREGDRDPGYRYALYLLSLGIPVYYEQMNAEFIGIDLADPQYENANPNERGWFVLVGQEYVKTDDTEIHTGTDYYYGAEISVESMYEGLEARFFDSDEGVADYTFDSMGDYAIKYITSGGYPTFEYGPLASDGKLGTSPLAIAMCKLANNREDAVALIDHTNNPNRTIYLADEYSVIARVREELTQLGEITGSYGAMFTPWYTCTHKAVAGGTTDNYGESAKQMPASIAYLSALAQQLRNYNPWLAVSGVTRGPVPYIGGLHTNYTLTNNVADSYQVIPGDVETLGASAISINPITYIRNYGYCIWGNRTLRNNADGTKASSFLNIRNLVSDIKKKLYDASLSLMFEQNTDILWINFKSIITPLLDSMVSNYILSDYNITRYLVNPEDGQPVPAYKVLANIRIMPINSVEVFDLTVTLENNEISVTETE